MFVFLFCKIWFTKKGSWFPVEKAERESGREQMHKHMALVSDIPMQVLQAVLQWRLQRRQG